MLSAGDLVVDEHVDAELENLVQNALQELGRDLGDFDEALLQLFVVRVVVDAVLDVLRVVNSKLRDRFAQHLTGWLAGSCYLEDEWQTVTQ